MDDPLMSISDVAAYMRLSVQRARQLLAEAKLACVQWSKDKRSRRWRRSTIDAWLAGMSGEPRIDVRPEEQPKKPKRRRKQEPDLSMMWGVR